MPANPTDPLDPALFRDETVDAETRATNARILDAMKDLPPLSAVPPEKQRAARAEGKGAFPLAPKSDRAKMLTARSATGEVPLRLVTPKDGNIKGVFLHMHGGGWVVGACDQQDPVLEWLADGFGLAAISVEYRLAPENPWPAPGDDCEAAALWVLDEAEKEFGTDNLIVGGESAGAHLAACTLLRLRDKHGYTGARGANLVYGVFDLGLSPSARSWDKGRLILDKEAMDFFVQALVPDASKRRNPDVSPAFADLRDMPPALFSVGTLDPLLDDTLMTYARWRGAGNEADLAVYPGGIHGFNALGDTLAKKHAKRLAGFLTGIISTF